MITFTISSTVEYFTLGNFNIDYNDGTSHDLDLSLNIYKAAAGYLYWNSFDNFDNAPTI